MTLRFGSRPQHERPVRVRRRWHFAALTSLATLACGAEGRVDGAVAFSPPAVYQRWWTLTEACSGLSGSLKRVQWMRAPATALQAAEGAGTVAYWSSRNNRIVLATNAIANGRIVRHEMLHALSRSRGHPASLFLARCAGVVRCDEACRGERGDSTLAGIVRRVPLESLLMAISSDPEEPSTAVDDGFFHITVSVTNPAPHAVLVNVRTGDPAIAVSLSPGDRRLISDHEVGDPRAAVFRAGERRQYVFDLRVSDPAGRVDIKPGAYQVRGHFDALSTPRLELKVRP